ncbi:hypothetical protein D3C72_961340 [compost metagenome]
MSGSKFEPMICTLRPTRPAVGLKLMMVGGNNWPVSSTQPWNVAVMVLLGRSKASILTRAKPAAWM